MKKVTRTIYFITLFLGVIPALAGLAICGLWNSILTDACGFGAIDFWQGVGIFILGQIASGGFVLGLMSVWGAVHVTFGHRDRMARHWHNMSEEEKREFISRRRSFFGNNRRTPESDEGE